MKKRLIASVEANVLEKLAQEAFDNMKAGKADALCEKYVGKADEYLAEKAEDMDSESIFEPDDDEYIEYLQDFDCGWEIASEMCNCGDLEDDKDYEKLYDLINAKFVADGYSSINEFVFEQGAGACTTDWDDIRYEGEKQEKEGKEDRDYLEREYYRSVI